jgi:hypothetical protein
MNTILNLACDAGAAEFALKVLNVARIDRKWGLIGQQVDIWIDYPQAVAAGLVAVSFFGRGIVGNTTAVVLTITPLSLKVCREFRFAHDKYDYTDVAIREAETLLGVVIKIINLSAAVCTIAREPQSSLRLHLGQASALMVFLGIRTLQLLGTGF